MNSSTVVSDSSFYGPTVFNILQVPSWLSVPYTKRHFRCTVACLGSRGHGFDSWGSHCTKRPIKAPVEQLIWWGEKMRLRVTSKKSQLKTTAIRKKPNNGRMCTIVDYSSKYRMAWRLLVHLSLSFSRFKKIMQFWMFKFAFCVKKHYRTFRPVKTPVILSPINTHSKIKQF